MQASRFSPTCQQFEEGVITCPLRGVIFYEEKCLGNDLLSVIQSSGVSVLEGLRMYGSPGENNQDTEMCLL